jgi:hypothetical protein
MNVLNRLLMILVCLGLIAAAVSIIVLTWTIPGETIDGLRNAVGWLEDNNQDFEKAVLTAVAAFVAFITLIVLLFELTPKSGGDVKVTDLRVGNAVLSTAAIGQRIEEAVRLVPHVVDVKSTVKTRGKGVAVGLDLHVDPDANLAEVTDAACQAASDVLTNRVHVGLAAPPRARLHYRELRLSRLQRPAPGTHAPAPAAPAPESGVIVLEEAPRQPVVAGVAPGSEEAAGQPDEKQPG